MRIRLLLALAGAATTAVLAVPSAVQADPPDTQIIGGGTVASAPWSAQVYRNNSFTCSGTIIAARYVLTAAHCTGTAMSVRVGNVIRGSGTLANVSSFSTRNDLALLLLDRSISTSFMPLGSTNPPTGATNSIYGWGMTCRTGCGAATQLKTATVRVTGLTTDAFGGQAIASTRINGNAWRGDSGGPQVYNGLQVGVASTADGVTRQNYGSVAFNRAWIRSVSGV